MTRDFITVQERRMTPEGMPEPDIPIDNAGERPKQIAAIEHDFQAAPRLGRTRLGRIGLKPAYSANRVEFRTRIRCYKGCTACVSGCSIVERFACPPRRSGRTMLWRQIGRRRLCHEMRRSGA